MRRRLSKRLLCGRRIDESAHRGDAIGRKADAPGVLLDGRLVWGEIDAVHLVAGYVAMQPLNMGAHFLQNLERLLRDFPKLDVGEISRSRNFTFDDKLGHGRPADVHRC